jgi:hypothetical protein
MNEDPRSAYFRLLHILSIAVPNTKVLDEFEIPEGVPKETRKLMIEAIDMSMRMLKATEQKLAELRRKLEVDEG